MEQTERKTFPMNSAIKKNPPSSIQEKNPLQVHSASKQRMIGLLTGFAAAVGYTLANMALRQMAKPADFDWAIWVTAQKAVPASLMTWTLVLNNYRLGRTAFPPRNLIIPLIVTGLIMQFTGNLMFQYALGYIGLAITVPITFALLLVSGAVCSRFVLGEPITLRSLFALTILMIAVVILSFGAGEASQAILKKATTFQFILGIVIASISGIGYGVCGVVIRKNVRNLPVSATLVLISTTGVVAMGTFSFCKLPLERILATTPEEYGIMLLAGIFNAAAFYAIGVSYRYLTVTEVNMVNTSQIAMATLMGVVFFMEPITPWLLVGVLLTVIGLFMMDKHG